MSPDLILGSSEPALARLAAGGDLAVSDAALWMLLLLRLAAVTTDERLELRNSEFSPKVWQVESHLTFG